MSLNIGESLNGRYRIVSVLGQGGMGAVYRAEDDNLHISVAVKENLFLSEEYTRQFQREAHILASLRHPNLPRVIDYFSVNGQGQYLIMDYIDGEDLRQRIERVGNLREREVVLIGAYICDALGYLHTRSTPVVHRDIKPGNIKITPEGEVVLVDFGLAKLMQSNQATTTGARAMTPGYSPPEQYGTARTDPRSDVYSLGATLYAALTGIIPEDGLSRATGKAELTEVRTLQPRIDKRIASVIEKALEVEPANRYQRAEEFKQGLIEAGNLLELSQPRFLVTPPPEESNNKSPFLLDDREELLRDSPDGPNFPLKSGPPRLRKKRSSFILPVALVLSFMILVALALSPNLQRVFSSANTPDPAQNTEMAVASEAVIPEAITPSATVKTILPVNSTRIPTLAPTATTSSLLQALTATATPSSPPPILAGSDMMAFASDRNGTVQIWTMRTDGTDQRIITDMVAGACQPAWSADGAMLAFISPCYRKENQVYEKSRIYTANADGSDLRILPVSQEGDFDPAWAPDGRRLAFTSLRTGTPHIFVYNFDDLTLHEMSDSRYPDFNPAWAPDGKLLAFARQDPYQHIWIMSDKGVTQFQFSSNGVLNDQWPNWSPDGQFIIFSRSSLEPVIPWLAMLRLEDRNSDREVRIQPPENIELGPISEPSLSPDGKYILYEGWPDGHNHDIYIMDLNGENRLRLTTDPGFDFSPSWRPLPQK